MHRHYSDSREKHNRIEKKESINITKKTQIYQLSRSTYLSPKTDIPTVLKKPLQDTLQFNNMKTLSNNQYL